MAYAIQNRGQVKPLTPPDRPVLRIEFANYGQAEWASLMPGAEIEPQTTTVRYQAKDILEAYQAMLVMTEPCDENDILLGRWDENGGLHHEAAAVDAGNHFGDHDIDLCDDESDSGLSLQ